VKQQQFLDVLDRDEAERRWLAAIEVAACGVETVALGAVHGRVLAADVRAEIDVPGFDRSNMDGFAVRAEDSFGASEEAPRRLRLSGETIPTGVAPQREVGRGEASPIATGGMLPRGADAVVPVEVTDVEGDHVVVRLQRRSS
jgi:putative molybdopterin biosynthesis protein